MLITIAKMLSLKKISKISLGTFGMVSKRFSEWSFVKRENK
ncbi:hypothetical protein PsWM33_04468 [Pseudovibrio sp. WM33]|nr:hypothetical protein PsWM33_04468 [Pseudovibrio sp. WM33]